MVAQALPRPPASTPPKGTPAAGNKPAPAPQQSTYALMDAVTDFNAWNTTIVTYKQDLLLLDDLDQLRQPSTDYWQLTDEDGQPIVLQDITPNVRNLNDAVGDLIRAEALEVSCPPGENPAATQEERDDAVGALDATMGHHLRHVLGDVFEQVKELVIKRGMCFVQVSWLDADDAAKLNRTQPLRWMPHDMFDCAWHVNGEGGVGQMIVLKKMLGWQLFPDWIAAAGITDLDLEQDVYEYWDETAHGVIVGGKVALPLTPHGYVDANGDPWCPFVPFVHKPRRKRIGQIAPVASGVSQRYVIVGTPLAESIVPTAISESRVMTKHLHQVDRSGGIIVMKGIVEREGGPAVDIDRGYAEEEDNPTANTRWIGPPDLTPIYGGAYQQLQRRMEASGMAQQIAAGQAQSAVSGRAVNSMTTVPRAKAESVAITLQQGWENVFMASVATWRTRLNNGAADNLRAAGQPPPAVIPTEAAHQFWFGDRVALAFYLGGGVRAIVPAALAGIRRIRVTIEPDTRMPDEVEMQQALALAQQATAAIQAGGAPLVNMDWIRSEKMRIDNPQAVKDAILMDREEMNPQSPWGQYRAREAVVNAMIGDLPDEEKPAIIQALAQQKQQALLAVASGTGGAPPPQPMQGGGGPSQPGMSAPPSTPGGPPAPPAPPQQAMVNPQQPPPFSQPPGPPGGFGMQPAGLTAPAALGPPQGAGLPPQVPTMARPPFGQQGVF